MEDRPECRDDTDVRHDDAARKQQVDERAVDDEVDVVQAVAEHRDGEATTNSVVATASRASATPGESKLPKVDATSNGTNAHAAQRSWARSSPTERRYRIITDTPAPIVAIADSATAMSDATFHELSLPGSASGFCSCPTFPGESGCEGQRVHETDEDDRDVDADADQSHQRQRGDTI